MFTKIKVPPVVVESRNVFEGLDLKGIDSQEDKKMAIKKMLTFGLEANMEKWLKAELTKNEVEQAQIQIADMHPLKKLPIENLFPSLQIFHNQINTFRKKREIWSASD